MLFSKNQAVPGQPDSENPLLVRCVVQKTLIVGLKARSKTMLVRIDDVVGA